MLLFTPCFVVLTNDVAVKEIIVLEWLCWCFSIRPRRWTGNLRENIALELLQIAALFNFLHMKPIGRKEKSLCLSVSSMTVG